MSNFILSIKENALLIQFWDVLSNCFEISLKMEIFLVLL